MSHFSGNRVNQDLFFDRWLSGWCWDFLVARISLDTRGRMGLRWPVAIITTVVLLGCSANPQRKYGLEPADQFLFERTHTPTPCEQSRNPQTGVRIVALGSNRPAHSVQRTDRMDFSRAVMPIFAMRLGPSMFEASANTSNNYSLELCAEAGAASESEAGALLEEIRLTRDDKVLSLSMPKFVQERPSTAFIQVQAPQETPITVNGEYAAMRVIGMNAPVHLSTTHARISLLDTTGNVDARAESGIIDFSGERGQVRLDADWEINLNFTARHFEGSLDARAAQPIRVLLPSGFASAFEVTVQRNSDFVCRADICDQIASHKREGKSVFVFGSGTPALHFVSLGGPVIVDSVDRWPAIIERN